MNEASDFKFAENDGQALYRPRYKDTDVSFFLLHIRKYCNTEYSKCTDVWCFSTAGEKGKLCFRVFMLSWLMDAQM